MNYHFGPRVTLRTRPRTSLLLPSKRRGESILSPCADQETDLIRSIRIHLLNLMDGSPYRVPPSNIIVWALPSGVEGTSVEDLVATGSRIMMYICLRDESHSGEIWRMIIWDWNTGELVLEKAGVTVALCSRHLPGV